MTVRLRILLSTLGQLVHQHIFATVFHKKDIIHCKKAGARGDCIRDGKPVVHNDYPSQLHRKGLPVAHEQIVRELVVPVKRNGKVVALLGVGNKPVDYTEADVNTVTLFADMAWDIAEKKLSELHFQRTEQILSSSTDIMALLDRQYTYVWANKAYLESFGLISEQLIGQSVATVFGDEIFNNVIKPAADRCLKGEKINYQEWFDFPATGHCYMEINYTPYFVEDTQIMSFIVNGRNITKNHQTEDALRVRPYNRPIAG
ncbi:MAG: GAF domain-containing protein [Pelovirga sp.]